MAMRIVFSAPSFVLYNIQYKKFLFLLDHFCLIVAKRCTLYLFPYGRCAHHSMHAWPRPQVWWSMGKLDRERTFCSWSSASLAIQAQRRSIPMDAMQYLTPPPSPYNNKLIFSNHKFDAHSTYAGIHANPLILPFDVMQHIRLVISANCAYLNLYILVCSPHCTRARTHTHLRTLISFCFLLEMRIGSCSFRQSIINGRETELSLHTQNCRLEWWQTLEQNKLASRILAYFVCAHALRVCKPFFQMQRS